MYVSCARCRLSGFDADKPWAGDKQETGGKTRADATCQMT